MGLEQGHLRDKVTVGREGVGERQQVFKVTGKRGVKAVFCCGEQRCEAYLAICCRYSVGSLAAYSTICPMRVMLTTHFAEASFGSTFSEQLVR